MSLHVSSPQAHVCAHVFECCFKGSGRVGVHASRARAFVCVLAPARVAASGQEGRTAGLRVIAAVIRFTRVIRIISATGANAVALHDVLG